MLATLLSATLVGLDGRIVRVEVDVAPGLPGLSIVGLPDAGVQEAKERVRGAVRNSGFAYPPRRIAVNLAPADLRKTGASLDLAIALGILLGSEQLRPGGRWALIGELSLGGELQVVPGILPMVAALAERGAGRVIVPAAGVAEAALAPRIRVAGASTLLDAAELVRGRRGRRVISARVVLGPETTQAGIPPSGAAIDGPGRAGDPTGALVDLAEVRGQLAARRALEIALAGGHGLLLVGPPGSGKTLLARTIPGLLPPLDPPEALAATIVASAAGARPVDLVRARPFRAPHHTSSYAAMVGGGPRLAPGEVTLASNGVLFLDELPEFGRDVLEALREPLEDGVVAISRVGRAVTLPARFQLVAAMNPCPCGGAADGEAVCRCPSGVPERYSGRVSGPLRDRIDLQVWLGRVHAMELVGGTEPEPSAPVAARIAAARDRQMTRQRALNGRLSGRHLRTLCGLDDASRRRAVALAELERSSARGTDRLLRVARTIADLDGAARVGTPHLDEAARFRLGLGPGSRLAAAV